MPSPPSSLDPSLRAGSTPEPESRPLENTGVRTSDRERQQVVDWLHLAFAEGRLDLGEHEARVDAAYAARYRADFAPLLADLPAEPAQWPNETDRSAPTWSALWISIVWRSRLAVLGARGDQRPTPAQQRTAALVAALALAWLATCAILGATLVAA